MRRQEGVSKKTVWIISAGTCAFFIGAMIFFMSVGIAGDATASGRTAGSPKAPVHIVEYVDFRCGPCARGAFWLKDFMARYPGKIYLEVRYFPLSRFTDFLDVRFAECAARQGKFWSVFEGLMTRQSQWARLPDPEKYFLDLAEELGLNVPRLTSCWQDGGGLRAEIMAMKEAGKQRGITSTPTYFINDKMVVGSHHLIVEVGSALGMSADAEGDEE